MRGEPAGLEVRRRQQHAVEASAGHLPERGVQPADLGDDVPTQGRVAAADHVDRRVQPVGQFEQHPPDPGVQLHRVGLGQAAGVGQDEAGRAGLGQAGRELVRLEHGDHVDVVHRLGSRGVVVQDRNPPPASAKAWRIRRRASGSTRAGGRSAVGFVHVIADVRRPGGRR
jgi:hypothetical protein